jgi:hypothetical protein
MVASTGTIVGSGVEEGEQMEQTLESYLQNPDEFHQCIQAAMTGDTARLPEIRALLDAVPEWAQEIGDLMQQTENQVLDMSVGPNLLKRQAIQRGLDDQEKRLREEPGHVEGLLIRQIRLDLLMLSAAQQRAQERRDVHSDKLLNGAHRRFLASVKCLEQLRKLSPSIRIQVAQNQINMA